MTGDAPSAARFVFAKEPASGGDSRGSITCGRIAYGARTLTHSPGFTVTAIVVLALGIGVNLAEVEIFAGVVAPLRVREPHMVRHLLRTGKDGAVYGFPKRAARYRWTLRARCAMNE